MCILFVYTLLKVTSYYDLSVLSMSMMGFQKSLDGGGWVGGVRSINFFWDFWNFFNFNFAKPLTSNICNFVDHTKLFFYKTFLNVGIHEQDERKNTIKLRRSRD